jgi:hypothetical protein
MHPYILKTSYHGHPDPLLCPKNRVRKSIALYYYTLRDDPKFEGRAKRETDFRPRKNKDKFDKSNQYAPMDPNDKIIVNI